MPEPTNSNSFAAHSHDFSRRSHDRTTCPSCGKSYVSDDIFQKAAERLGRIILRSGGLLVESGALAIAGTLLTDHLYPGSRYSIPHGLSSIFSATTMSMIQDGIARGDRPAQDRAQDAGGLLDVEWTMLAENLTALSCVNPGHMPFDAGAWCATAVALWKSTQSGASTGSGSSAMADDETQGSQ